MKPKPASLRSQSTQPKCPTQSTRHLTPQLLLKMNKPRGPNSTPTAQAYNCLTDRQAEQVPMPEPGASDPRDCWTPIKQGLGQGQ